MATIPIPHDAPYVRGHFIGRPIVPGVVEVQLVVDQLSQEAGRRLTLRAIRFARLRQLVVPGDELEVTARAAEPPYARVDVKRNGTVVANMELELGAEPIAEMPEPLRFAGQPVTAPALDLLLPHRPPMRLIEAIERESELGLECTARVSAECGLTQEGGVSALLALEAAAQAAAAWEAVRRSREAGGAPRIGYLVAMREVRFFVGSVPAGVPVRTRVVLEDVALPLTHYAVEAAHDGRIVVQGKIATVLTDETL
jgi:predicted hotdog family 3-hydroxylacyl-ACP dehydratase